jgi:acetoin utilization protein AcuB
MQGIPPIKAVMTPFPYWIDKGEPIAAARKMMAGHSIRHLPVMEAGRLVGVITDRDINLILDPGLGDPPEGKTVGDICVSRVYVVDLMEPLDRVLLHMAKHHIGSALVMKDGRLVGIFTVTDACRWFGEMLQSLFPPADDQEPA